MSSPLTLLDRYCRVRAATEAACAPLSPEDMVVQSMPEASPAKWHLAHTTWFFETFVLSDQALGNYQPFNSAYNFLFNSYYEAVGARHPQPKRGLLTRPSADEVYRYRAHVDRAMSELIPRLERGDLAHLQAVLEIGLNHEQQHLELLLTDIKHAFSQNPLRPAYCELPISSSSSVAALKWVDFEAGVRSIGHAGEGEGFAFDNELPRHRVFLEPFAIATRPATCGEYSAFMDAGGYSRPEFWLSDGWQACQQNDWQAPLYWERHGSCWNFFTLGGMRPVSMNEPVGHLSFYEADAFARWSGARLPTEAEWEVACSQPVPVMLDPFAPVRLHPGLVTGDCQLAPGMFGDLWEWTQSSYSPYPGYRPSAGALGEYNGKFMCNQMVLRGGSCLTPRSHLRATYRNFFSPEARWQFSSLRLARSS